MADKTHTTEWKLKNSASQELEKIAKGAEEAGLGMEKAGKASDELEKKLGALSGNDAFEVLGNSAKQLDEDIRRNRGLDELRTRIQNTLDTIVEFGGTVEDQRAALAAIEEQARRTGMPIALVAKAAEKLADEADDGAAASKHLATALKLAEQANLKTEDSAALVGRALKGETDALRKLGPSAARVADAIDKIPDANERAAATTAALNNRLAQGPSRFDKMYSAAARLDVQLAQMGIGGNLATTAMGNLGTMIGSTLVAALVAGAAAWKAYNDSTADGKKLTQQTKETTKETAVTLGALAEKALGVSDAMTQWNARLQALETAIEKNLEPISTFMGYAGKAWGIVTLFTPIGILIAQVRALLEIYDDLVGTSKEYDRFNKEQAAAGHQEMAGAMARNALETFELNDAMKWLTKTTEGYIETSKDFVAQLEREYQKRRELANELGSGSGMVEGPFMESGKFHLKDTEGERKGKEIEQEQKRQAQEAKQRAKQRQRDAERERKREEKRLEKAAEQRVKDMKKRAEERVRATQAQTGWGVAAGLGAAMAGGPGGLMAGEQYGSQMDMATRAHGGVEAKQGEMVIDSSEIVNAAAAEQEQAAARLDEAWESVAQGGLNSATTSMIGLVGALAEGTLKAKDFGKAILGALGGTLEQMGYGMILMGTGVKNIESGVTDPASLIAVGASMVILGSAMKGFASRKSAGGGSNAASAVQQGFNSAQERQLQTQQRHNEEMTVVLNAPGFERFMFKAVQRGAERNAIPALAP